MGLALFYGGGAQLLAGMWEFRKGNTFGALAFSSFGAFWLAFWFYVAHIVPTLPAADANKATGVFLLAWTIFTAYMTIASLRTTGAVAAVFVALTLTFLFLCIGAFADSTGWTKVGRLGRIRHRRRGLVRVIRWCHEFNVQAHRAAHLAACIGGNVASPVGKERTNECGYRTVCAAS